MAKKPKRLKVALYIPWIYQKGGVERTFLELIRRSRHDWTVFTHRYEPENTFPGYSRLKVVQLGRVPVRRTFTGLLEAALSMLSARIPVGGFDVFVVSTSGFAEFVAVRNHSIPTIAFCHTPLRVLHDPVIRRKYLAEHPKKGQKLKFDFFAGAYLRAEKVAWSFFKFVVVANKEVAGRVRTAGTIGAEKIRFLKYGVDCAKYRGKRPKNYFLLPGRIMWTKNVELGIAAYELMIRRNPKLSLFKLVVAGGVDEKSRKYYQHLRKLHVGRGVRFYENPSEEELMRLYSECYCVLFTALNEDWGLVPLEGMAFSKPVVAVDQGGPRESVADCVSGYLARPAEEDFAEKMERLAKNPALAKRMGAAGRKRAKKYDWRISAKMMDGYAEQAAKMK
jgi:glycosyltransferase involved in cell wall biosynthesis